MDGDLTPDPHQAEILEALLEAAMKGDAEEYDIFRREWERSDPIDSEGWHMRFSEKSPIPYTAVGFCYHCQSQWVVSGVAFGQMVPGLSLMIHVTGECPEMDDCNCWVDDTEGEDRPFGYARCQRCDRAEPICECDGGVAYGPCALFERHERENGFDWHEHTGDVSPPE